MAITYPRTDLLGLAKLGAGCRFQLGRYQETGRTAGGLFLTADLADPVWTAEYVTTATMTHAEAATLVAALDSLAEGSLLFEGFDIRRRYPAAYSNGVFTDAGAIASTPTDRNTLSLSGLPANFAISVGDYFRIDYGTGSKYRALHRVVEAVTADGSGATGVFTVRPALQTGISTSAAVRFKLPSCYMAVVPGSVQETMVDRLFSQVRFQAVQVHAKP